MKLPKIYSGVAFLDVKSGRKTLSKIVEKKPVPVTIKGFITCQASGDDGESIEFQVDVKKVSLK